MKRDGALVGQGRQLSAYGSQISFTVWKGWEACIRLACCPAMRHQTVRLQTSGNASGFAEKSRIEI